MPYWLQVAKGVLTCLGLPALVAALISAWCGHRLQRANDRLKAELQQAVKEHEVRFSALHARQVGVLAKLYRRLLYANSAYMALTNTVVVAEGEPSTEEKESFLWQKWTSFSNYFNLNRIWLCKDLCDEIDAYAKQWNSGRDTYWLWRHYTSSPPHVRDMASVQHEMSKLPKHMEDGRKELDVLLKKIIADFRKHLGADG